MSKLLLLPTEHPLIASPKLCKQLGVIPAFFLQKLHFILTNQKADFHKSDGKKWWHHTLDQWVSTLEAFSIASIKRAIAKLKDLGILIVAKLSANPFDRTNYYSIDYSKLAKLVGINTKQDAAPAAQPSQPTLPTNQPFKGTTTPTQPVATTAQLTAMPKATRQLYQRLRSQKLDISNDDPRLVVWLANEMHIIRQVAYQSQFSMTRGSWHTPEQLGIQ